MPSKSRKQARFMAACAHGAGYKSCPPKSVAREFNRHDQRAGILKKAEGGKVKSVSALAEAVRALALDPTEHELGRSMRPKRRRTDNIEDPLREFTESLRHLPPVERRKAMQQVLFGDEESVIDTVLNTHEQLFPLPIKPTEAPPALIEGRAPKGHGDLSDEQWRVMLGLPIEKAGGGKVRNFSKYWDLLWGKLDPDEQEQVLREINDEGVIPPLHLMGKIARGLSSNTPEYDKVVRDLGWDPKMPGIDFTLMAESMFPHHEFADNDIAEALLLTYGTGAPKGLRTFRGAYLDDPDVTREGFQLDQPTVAATSLDKNIAKFYSGDVGDERASLLFDIAVPEGMQVLPRPGMLQDEFMLPSDTVLEVVGKPRKDRKPSKYLPKSELLFAPREYTVVPVEARKKRAYAKGGKVKTVRELKEALDAWQENKLPQRGFFSTLDELIATAPEETMPVYMWQRYLQPGRKLNRDGIEFPLKKEELDYARIGELDKVPLAAAGLERGPNVRLTKDQLREYVRLNRPELVTAAKVDAKFLDTNTADSFAEKRGYRPEYLGNTHYDLDSLRHASIDYPDAYEESITTGPDLGHFPSHFSPFDIAWSRTTRHEVPATRQPVGDTSAKMEGDSARLIEEIQSDRHSAAAERYYAPTPELKAEHEDIVAQLREKYPNNYWGTYTDPDHWGLRPTDGGPNVPLVERLRDNLRKSRVRRGYRPEHMPELEDLDNQRDAARAASAEAWVTYKHMSELHGPDSAEALAARAEVQRLGAIEAELLSKMDKYRSTPPDAPFKDPRDYATLEIRKQLLNAVNENDRFLALTRGDNQIARYEQGMDERRSRGMREMYDRVYPSVLEKEAGRYGAKMGRIDIPLELQAADTRPNALVNVEAETIDDWLEAMADIEQYSDPRRAYIAAMSNTADLLDEMVERAGDAHVDQALRDRIYAEADAIREQLMQTRQTLKEVDDDALIEALEAGDGFDTLYGQNRPIHRVERLYREVWPRLTGESGADAIQDQRFPAAEITPEVADRIRRVGVPIFKVTGALAGASQLLDELPGEEQDNAYAEGGEVEGEWWRRPLSGFLSQWIGVDPETGDTVFPPLDNLKKQWRADERRREGLPKEPRVNLGIVDETLSLPALGELVGLEAPEFATKAAERADAARGAGRRLTGVGAPHGFKDNFQESAGVMIGQVPLPAGAFNRLKALKNRGLLNRLRNTAGTAAEWFTPSVNPRVSNYAVGTGVGGTIGGGLDLLLDKQAEKQMISEAVAEVLAEELEREQLEADQVLDAEVDAALAEAGYAQGGRVVGRNDPNPQLLPGGSPASSTPSIQTPYTGDWNTYGERGEHKFFGDRKIPELKGWVPSGPGAPPPPKASSGGSSSAPWALLGLAAGVGKDLWDKYKDHNTGEYPEFTHDDMAGWSEAYLQGLPAPTLDGVAGEAAQDFWSRMDAAARSGSGSEDYLQSLRAPELAEFDLDPTMWDYLSRAWDAGKGALGVYMGASQGGVGGTGAALSGAGDIASTIGYNTAGEALGSAGQVLSGIDQGGVKGYGQATVGALDLANQAGYAVPGTETITNALGPAVALYGAYQGAEALEDSIKANDAKSGLMAGASAGASLGSIFGPVGTAIGAVAGGALGAMGVGAGGDGTAYEQRSEGLWDNYRKAVKEHGRDLDIRQGNFQWSSALTGARNATGYKEMMDSIKKGKQGNDVAFVNDFYKKMIRQAQLDGKLPKSNEELRQIDGKAFFDKEVAPLLWKGQNKVDQDLVNLMRHTMDYYFGLGLQESKGVTYSQLDHRSLSERAAQGDTQAINEVRNRAGIAP